VKSEDWVNFLFNEQSDTKGKTAIAPCFSMNKKDWKRVLEIGPKKP